MAIILKTGRSHKGYIWYDTCDLCESVLKLYEDKNDPQVDEVRSCGAYFTSMRYRCPVCAAENRTFAAYGGGYDNINNDECQKRARRGKTRREYVTLTREDLEEIRSYQKDEEGSAE